MTKEEVLKIQIETIDELLEVYKTTAENTFGRKIKRNGLIFQVAKELKYKYETSTLAIQTLEQEPIDK